MGSGSSRVPSSDVPFHFVPNDVDRPEHKARMEILIPMLNGKLLKQVRPYSKGMKDSNELDSVRNCRELINILSANAKGKQEIIYYEDKTIIFFIMMVK